MKKQFSMPRLILAIVGFAVLAIACCLCMPTFPDARWKSIFITLSVLQIYILFVIPAIFSYAGEKKKDSLIIGGAVYYRGFALFATILIVLIVLALNTNLSSKAAFGIDILSVFILAVYAYLAGATKEHIDNVAAAEADKTFTLDSLKQKIMELQVKVSGMNGKQADICERVNKLAENLRYLSPSNQAQAVKLEKQMLSAVTSLAESDISANKNGGADDLIRQQLDNIENLYKLRKNIY